MRNHSTGKLERILQFVLDKNILWFVVCTYLVTWTFWLAAFKVNGFFRIVGSFIPSVMGIIFTCRQNKESGLKILISSIKRYKVKWYLYLFVVFYTVLSFLIPRLIAEQFENLGAFQVKKSIAIFDISNPLIALACFAMILIAGGPLGEEFGWRGFLLPKLEERLRPDLSGIIVGVVWGMLAFTNVFVSCGRISDAISAISRSDCFYESSLHMALPCFGE